MGATPSRRLLEAALEVKAAGSNQGHGQRVFPVCALFLHLSCVMFRDMGPVGTTSCFALPEVRADSRAEVCNRTLSLGGTRGMAMASRHSLALLSAWPCAGVISSCCGMHSLL